MSAAKVVALDAFADPLGPFAHACTRMHVQSVCRCVQPPPKKGVAHCTRTRLVGVRGGVCKVIHRHEKIWT